MNIFTWPFIAESLYFDHNATTPLARPVRRAMGHCLAREFGNGSSLHTMGRGARGLIEQARGAVAKLIGARPDQIVFTSGGTEANNTVIKGVFGAFRNGTLPGHPPDQAKGPGHIITTLIEHESILGACTQVELAGGAVSRLPAGRDGRLDPEKVRAALRPDTLLISVMHANNEIGVIQPIREIAKIARETGVLFHTDAVQSTGKLAIDVESIGCDFLSLTAHKINGPKGAGALYCRQPGRLFPLIFGGDQERGQRAGTEGTHQIVGLGAACDLAAGRGREELERLRGLRETLIAGMRALHPELVINEAASEHQLPGTISASFSGRSGLRLLAGLDCHGIGVSIGSACTADRIEPSHVLLGMGLSAEHALSTIRLSMGTTTNRLSVWYLLHVLKDVLQHDPPGFAYIDPEHLDEKRIRSGTTMIVDLRFPHERMLEASIPGAEEWSAFGYEQRLAAVPRDREVIFLCATGVISTGAAYRLAQSGHPATRVIFGGFSAWRARYPDLLPQLRSGAPL